MWWPTFATAMPVTIFASPKNEPMKPRTPFVLLAGLWLFAVAALADTSRPFRIDVVDDDNGWPVSLVELRTTHGLRFVTDNAGRIACDAPELNGVLTWFTVSGHGYEVPADGFGNRGVRLTPTPGGAATVKVKRALPAKRLGRLTGAGLFAESQKLGLETEGKESGVFGCDSIQSVVYGGKKYWMWGDTTMPHYVLGLFHMTGGTTAPRLTSIEAPLRLTVDYFRDDTGRPRVLAPFPGAGPTWISGLAVLPDREGSDRLVCAYHKIKPPLESYETGLGVWNDETARFDPLKVVWTKTEGGPPSPALPEGHAVRWTDPEGRAWLMFGDPFPNLRCPVSYEAWADPSQWEKLEPQKHVTAAADGKAIEPHRGSIIWHPWRERWVAIFCQNFGAPSAFGEIWYAEADAPTGPWGPAVKVLSHDDYSFYNPFIHAEFAPDNTPVLIFEGTYTATFSGAKQPTPRYDYNQILYRLDLDDSAFQAAKPGG